MDQASVKQDKHNHNKSLIIKRCNTYSTTYDSNQVGFPMEFHLVKSSLCKPITGLQKNTIASVAVNIFLREISELSLLPAGFIGVSMDDVSANLSYTRKTALIGC